MSELILYTTDDGRTQLHLRVEGESIWLSQMEIAELFQTTKQNVSLHAKNIFEDNELSPKATVKESLTVQSEGNRQVRRRISYYNLDLILAIGYRVRSPRGVQFRQWASTHLNDQPVLEGAGSVSRENMEKIARERYEVFDQQWRIAQAKAADAADLKEIEQLEHDLKHKGKKPWQVSRYDKDRTLCFRLVCHHLKRYSEFAMGRLPLLLTIPIVRNYLLWRNDGLPGVPCDSNPQLGIRHCTVA